MTCTHPRDPRAKQCRACHARQVAQANNAAGVTQTDQARQRRVASYRSTRVGYVPVGMEADNARMRNSHIGTDERKRIFARHGITEFERAAGAREARRRRDEY